MGLSFTEKTDDGPNISASAKKIILLEEDIESELNNTSKREFHGKCNIDILITFCRYWSADSSQLYRKETYSNLFF